MRRDGEPLGGSIQGSLLDAIGETPLVELRNVVDDSKGRLVAKLESFNPTGSKEDRVARQVLEDARAEGQLARCQTIVAAVDGVSGLALAQACAVRRHPLVAVMLRGTGEAQATAMEVLGCDIEWLEPDPCGRIGQPTAGDRARLAERVAGIQAITGAFDPALASSASVFRAHRKGTGPEFSRQSGGCLGAFVDFVGTGGTLAGCAAAFQEQDGGVKCYAAEPEVAAAISGARNVRLDHGILGGGFGLAKPPLLAPEHLAGSVLVTRDEAERAMHDLARREGIVTGLSTGANLAAARKLLEGPCFGDVVGIIVHDTGGRLASARLREQCLAATRERAAA